MQAVPAEGREWETGKGRGKDRGKDRDKSWSQTMLYSEKKEKGNEKLSQRDRLINPGLSRLFPARFQNQAAEFPHISRAKKYLPVGLQIGEKGLQINERRMQIAFNGYLFMRYALLPRIIGRCRRRGAARFQLLIAAWIFWGIRHA